MANLVRRLDANHDMTFGRGRANYATGGEAVAQKVTTRLLMFNGEWFLDTSAGLPWINGFNSRPSNLPYIEATIKQAIIDTLGVDEIITFAMSFDSIKRKLSISVSLTTVYGTTENIQVTP